jgi:hypothetical protein
MPTQISSGSNPSAEPASKPKKGFSKGVSGNPAGRPRGSQNRATLLAQAFFAEYSQEILEKVRDLALEKGDLAALKMCLDRVAPPIKSRPVTFELPEIDTAQDLVRAHVDVLRATSRGELTPDEASKITDMLEACRRAMDIADVAERVERIEEKLELSA